MNYMNGQGAMLTLLVCVFFWQQLCWLTDNHRLAADNIWQHNESGNTLATCTRGTEFWSVWLDWQVSQKKNIRFYKKLQSYAHTRSSYCKCDLDSFCRHIRLLMENPVQRLGATGAGEVLPFLFLLTTTIAKWLVLCTCMTLTEICY